MAKHMVKCPICGEMFDANIEPYVMINSRRYAHEKCQQDAQARMTKEEQDKQALENYIKNLFSYSKLPAKVNSQIKDYVTNRNYSYSAILKTLKYWFDIKKSPIEKANGGIGIVPFVIDDACQYWQGIFEAREKNKDIDIKKINLPVREIHIRPPERQPMKHFRKLFTFLEEDEE